MNRASDRDPAVVALRKSPDAVDQFRFEIAEVLVVRISALASAFGPRAVRNAILDVSSNPLRSIELERFAQAIGHSTFRAFELAARDLARFDDAEDAGEAGAPTAPECAVPDGEC